MDSVAAEAWVASTAARFRPEDCTSVHARARTSAHTHTHSARAKRERERKRENVTAALSTLVRVRVARYAHSSTPRGILFMNFSFFT